MDGSRAAEGEGAGDAESVPQRLRHKLGALDDFSDRFVDAERPADSRSPRSWRATSALKPGRGAGRRVPAGLGAAAPAHEFPRRRRPRAPARDEPRPRRPQARARRGNRAHPPAQSQPAGAQRHTDGRWAIFRADGARARRADAHRLPALVDAQDAVVLQVFDSPEKAHEAHRAGVRRLFAIAFATASGMWSAASPRRRAGAAEGRHRRRRARAHLPCRVGAQLQADLRGGWSRAAAAST
jgi:hypothetical protein